MIDATDDGSSLEYSDAHALVSHEYLLPKVCAIIDGLAAGKPTRIFDVGAGNGSVANELCRGGHQVTGVDPSATGVAQANKAYPAIRIELGSAYDDLAQRYGRFPVVLSLEVIEHLLYPRRLARTAFDLLEPGGTLILSTPYHGYLKNVALALSGRMDAHFTALWDGGHVKFWSFRTLRALLLEAGFVSVRFHRVGRVPPLAKSMIAVAGRP